MRIRTCLGGWAAATCFISAAAGCSSATHDTHNEADSTAPRDGGTREERNDDVIEDASQIAQDSEGGGCGPINVSAFQPPPVVPIITSTACNGFNGDGGLVQAYGDACLGHSATFAACAAVEVPDAAGASDCYRCLTSQQAPDASQYGAAVVLVVPLVDYAGCIQALDPTEAGASCADSLTAAAFCDEYACKSTCPVHDDQSAMAYTDCSNAAINGACAGYWPSAMACIGAAMGDGGTPVATVCFGGATAEDHYLSTAHYFCGGR